MAAGVEGMFSGAAWKVIDTLIRMLTVIGLAWVGWIGHQVDALRAVVDIRAAEAAAVSTRVSQIESNRFTATDAMRAFREVDDKTHQSISIMADKLDAKLDAMRAEMTMVRESLARQGRVGP